MPTRPSHYTDEQRRAAVDRARVIGYTAAGLELKPPVSDSCVNHWRKRLGIPKFDSPGHGLYVSRKWGKPKPSPSKLRTGPGGYRGEQRKRRTGKPGWVPPEEGDPFLRVEPCKLCHGKSVAPGSAGSRCPLCVLAPCGKASLTAGLPKLPETPGASPDEHECYGCDGCGRWRKELGSPLLNRCRACWGTGRDDRDRGNEIRTQRRATNTKCLVNLPDY